MSGVQQETIVRHETGTPRDLRCGSSNETAQDQSHKQTRRRSNYGSKAVNGNNRKELASQSWHYKIRVLASRRSKADNGQL